VSDPLSDKKKKLLAQRLQGKRGRLTQEVTGIKIRPADTPCLASPGQERIWRLIKLQNSSHSYHITSSVLIEGSIDPSTLERSIQEVIARHSILRSTYQIENDTLLQRIHNDSTFKLEVFNTAKENSLTESARREAQKPLDIEQGPLLRCLLFRKMENSSLLTLVVSDLIFDKWSLGIFWKEVSIHYNCFINNSLSQLQPLSIQYDDFAHWQRDWLKKDTSQKQLQYWKEQLSNLPPPLTLATDHPYPTRIADHGKLAQLKLPTSLSQKIHSLAQVQQTSSVTLCLLGFGLLLQRYSQLDDVVIATPVANRRQKETAQLIGFFLNTLPIRIQTQPKQSTTNALKALQETMQQALLNQDVPLHKITETIDIPRMNGRHPLCQTMFVYQRQEEAQPLLKLGDAKIQHTIIDIEISKFDLTLFVAEQENHINCILEYRTDLFEADTANQFLKHFEAIMTALTAEKEHCISVLNIHSKSDKELIHRFQAGPSTQIDPSRLIPQLICEQAHNSPHKIALQSSHKHYDYQALLEASAKIAKHLSLAGVTHGQVVALYMDKSIEAIIALLGIIRSGATYLPVDPDYPMNRCAYMLKDSRASVILTDNTDSSIFHDSTTAAVIAFEDAIKEPDTSRLEHTISEENLAYIIYTSGSTGEPKGVGITHHNLLYSTLARHSLYTKSPPEKFLLLPSLSFDSSIAGIFWTLTHGGTLVIPEAVQVKDPEQTGILIEQLAVDSLLCVPTLYQNLLNLGSNHIESLKTVIVAGEACPLSLVRQHFTKLPQTSLFNEYGPTEATVWSTVHQCSERDLEQPSLPIGKPIPNTAVFILDSNQQAVPIGHTGELYITGDGIAKGYINDSKLNDDAFVTLRDQQRAYKTGDLGKWLPNGDILFVGRSDDQLKLHGYRIEAGEIEKQLESHPTIKQAIVVAANTSTAPSLDDLAQQVPPEVLTNFINQVQAADEKHSSHTRRSKRNDFTLELKASNPSFIQTPRKAQRDWLLAQVMAEISDDLEHLHTIAPQFVPGIDHDLGADLIDITDKALSKDAIMEDWQYPLMKAMAQYTCESHGDVLEIGFGRGISAEMIQEEGVRSHSIIEINPHSIKQYFEPWRQKHATKDIRLHADAWQTVEPNLPLYDGIFFHAFPLNEKEFSDYVLNSVTFAEHAFPYMAKHLKEDGAFTYLTTEIDSLSRRHQRLLFKHFKSISMHIQELSIPEDTRDTWWAPSMVVVKAIK